MKFNTMKMEDALDALIDYRGKTPKKSKTGIMTLSAKSVKNNHIDYSQCYFISEEEYEKFMVRGFPKKGDILLTTEAPLGLVARLDRNDVAIAQRLLTLRGKENVLDNDYLLYYLQSPIGQASLKARETGTTVTGIKQAEFRKIEIEIPDYEVQKKVSGILRVIDQKIELNNAINNNLAEQSQAIFAEFMCKYPYVLSPLSDIAEIIDCLHSKKPEAVNDTAYQLLQLNNITDSGFLDLSSKYYISKSDYENWTRKCEIVEGDCVITNVGRIGAVSQAPNGTHAAMGRNMTCIRLRKDKPFYSYLITALLSPHIRREIMKNTDEGTIMGALNVKNIPLLLFPMFAPPTMNALEDLLSPIRKAIEQNYLSNQTLSLLRDSLLPRLMSGELDVSDIDL